MLRVACCYRTVFYEAAAVVSSMPPLCLMPPLSLLAEERTMLYEFTDKGAARELLLENWSDAVNGRWKKRLIGEIRSWFNRRHGKVSFHTSQMLTGHGCFNYYLHRFGKSTVDKCSQCGARPDDANHAIFQCDSWFRWRREACV